MPTYGIRQLREEKMTNATFFVYLENIMHLVAHTPHISTEMVATYKDMCGLKQACTTCMCRPRRIQVHQWFPTSYRLTTEDVCLIVNDWEEGWKIPTEKT
jgi:hypothetical protein